MLEVVPFCLLLGLKIKIGWEFFDFQTHYKVPDGYWVYILEPN
jgi:hypothetical protein